MVHATSWQSGRVARIRRSAAEPPRANAKLVRLHCPRGPWTEQETPVTSPNSPALARALPCRAAIFLQGKGVTSCRARRRSGPGRRSLSRSAQYRCQGTGKLSNRTSCVAPRGWEKRPQNMKYRKPSCSVMRSTASSRAVFERLARICARRTAPLWPMWSPLQWGSVPLFWLILYAFAWAAYEQRFGIDTSCLRPPFSTRLGTVLISESGQAVSSLSSYFLDFAYCAVQYPVAFSNISGF